MPLGDITKLLAAMKKGDSSAESKFIAAVYKDLHAIARRAMSRERSGHTLQATALVNETYLRLMGKDAAALKDRVHFFATAATVMRHVLSDYARERQAKKRGGSEQIRVELDDRQGAKAIPLDDY